MEKLAAASIALVIAMRLVRRALGAVERAVNRWDRSGRTTSAWAYRYQTIGASASRGPAAELMVEVLIERACVDRLQKIGHHPEMLQP